MEAEYFPPSADVILENQTPTDFYVLVSGAVDFVAKIHGHDQVFGKAITGGIFGETGVLCNMPQRLAVRTTEISQVLRPSRTKLMKLILANTEDGDTIMNNLFQRLKGTQSFRFAKQRNDLNSEMGV